MAHPCAATDAVVVDCLAQQTMEAFAFLLELVAFGQKTTSNRSDCSALARVRDA